ncbi:MAG: 23S rRNA methyltransferase [Rhodospirillaceae bacterium TMED167]|nr:23S rRNA methyltransferase [Rhodospirillaceae bacterium]OUW25628.1 MAG: 23S rRNA methyltransferase [Rhodospirillaceae bacterium TMED167]
MSNGRKGPGTGKKRSTASSGRNLHTRVKTAKRRKTSSTRWLQRQLNDPYVAAAQKDGYRSRAAYKLIELNDRFNFLKPGTKVVDLGAAPGGWTQVVLETLGDPAAGASSAIIALDLLDVDPLPGVDIMIQDFMADDAPKMLKSKLPGGAGLVLSDMAPALTGHTPTDHLRIMAVVEAAYLFACEVLTPDGCFIAKVFQGGTEQELLAEMKKRFRSVKHAKPPASRAESSEVYVVAQGFRHV